MRKILVGAIGAAALGLVAPASAADMAARPYTKAPPPMVATIYDWSGFYIGINGGGGSARNCWDFVSPVGSFPEGCHDGTGGTVGGQIGYRWQATNWVFGIEGQGNWADFKGSNVNLLAGTLTGGTTFGAGLTDVSKVDSFGLITAQVGYAWNNVLFYIKGGAAVTGNKFHTFTPTINLVDSHEEIRWGGTVGTGFEFGFAPNWSVGIEYDHLFMGGRNVTAVTPAGVFSATDHISQDVDVGLVRLNYRWGGPSIARY